jgi:hypothetical protein
MRACCFRALWLAMALSMGVFAQDKGIEPDWDIRPVLKEIAAHAQRMVPVLEQIDAKEMAKNGAASKLRKSPIGCSQAYPPLSSVKMQQNPQRFFGKVRLFCTGAMLISGGLPPPTAGG